MQYHKSQEVIETHQQTKPELCDREMLSSFIEEVLPGLIHEEWESQVDKKEGEREVGQTCWKKGSFRKWQELRTFSDTKQWEKSGEAAPKWRRI